MIQGCGSEEAYTLETISTYFKALCRPFNYDWETTGCYFPEYLLAEIYLEKVAHVHSGSIILAPNGTHCTLHLGMSREEAQTLANKIANMHPESQAVLQKDADEEGNPQITLTTKALMGPIYKKLKTAIETTALVLGVAGTFNPSFTVLYRNQSEVGSTLKLQEPPERPIPKCRNV